VGVDAVPNAMYAEDLEAHLQDLSARLQRLGYRPQPKRRIDMPKPGSETGRPLGISRFEATMVALATTRVLAPLVEPLCEAGSDGSRPPRRPHQGLDARGRTLQHKRVTSLGEADRRGCCDAVHHAWWLQCLRQRIGDERGLRLIRRRGKAGIMDNGLVQTAEGGTPHGAMLSPRLANVSLHDV
jgi:retron-type reverse transcriptase